MEIFDHWKAVKTKIPPNQTKANQMHVNRCFFFIENPNFSIRISICEMSIHKIYYIMFILKANKISLRKLLLNISFLFGNISVVTIWPCVNFMITKKIMELAHGHIKDQIQLCVNEKANSWRLNLKIDRKVFLLKSHQSRKSVGRSTETDASPCFCNHMFTKKNRCNLRICLISQTTQNKQNICEFVRMVFAWSMLGIIVCCFHGTVCVWTKTK